MDVSARDSGKKLIHRTYLLEHGPSNSIDESMLNFILHHCELSLELSRLLGVRFFPGRGLQGPVGKMLARIILHHNQGNHEYRDREITKLSLLKDELKQIEEFDPELLRKFRNQYRRGNRPEYFGTRMEIAAASCFVRKNISFIKQESPDFVICRPNGKKVFVECGSTHLSIHKAGNIGYKISSSIRAKVILPYFSTATVLFLDITNVLHNSLISRAYLEQQAIESVAKQQMDEKPIGGTCLFFYVMNKESDSFDLQFIRVDNNTADPELTKFLNELLPVGDQDVSDYDIPSEG